MGGSETRPYQPDELIELANYRAIVKLVEDGAPSRPLSLCTFPPLPFPKDERVKETIIRVSR